jgi:predicted nucleic acid-binding protein
LAEASVVDASPLILLSRAGYLPLLTALSPTVVLTSSVLAEVQAKGEDDPAMGAIEDAPWLVHVPAFSLAPEISAWKLGLGEASVLSWAIAHPGTIAILDDARGRRSAAILRIPVVGTVGVVLIAKRKGLIQAAGPVLERLMECGMFISNLVLSEALELAGE